MPLDVSRKPAGFNTVTKSREYDRLVEALLSRAEAVCAHLLPHGRKLNGEWRVGSLQGERGKSMGVNLRDGVWKDFDGGDGGRDLLSLWADKKGIKPHEAYDEAAAWLGWERHDNGPKPSAKIAAIGGKPIAPQPVAEAKDEDELWWRKVTSTKRWEYFDADGELWVTVCRFERPGEKVIRPWDHKARWDEKAKKWEGDWKWPKGTRPLFNLVGIRKSPDPIIIVEGEKCADRLNALGYCATTMPGGANAARSVDWTPLAGREVIRWADNDLPKTNPKTGAPIPQACLKWLETTRECLSAAGARAIRDVGLPGQTKPDGWDCADATDDEIRGALRAAAGTPAQRLINADELQLPFLASIPKRRFVYGYAYMRGTVTVTAGEGGSGKSALHVVEALAIATGRDLLETGKPIERCRVWMIALEDDENEMHRRIGAAMMHFNIDRGELAGWLYLTTRSKAPDFLLAISDRNGTQISAASVSDMKAGIVGKGIGFVSMDPYVYAHLTNENDNSAQAAVMSAIVSIAQDTNVAFAIVHHAKKPSANDRGGPSAGDIRGAGAIVNSARHGRLVNSMTSAEADKLGVDEQERLFYFRTSSVKANYSPPGDRAGDWYKMHGVKLPNGAADEDGDGVGVVTRWKAPDPFKAAGVTVDILRRVQDEVERALKLGNPYRASDKAKPWIGEAIGDAIGLEPKDKGDKAKINAFLKGWLKSGALVQDRWNDGHQRRPIIRSGPLT